MESAIRYPGNAFESAKYNQIMGRDMPARRFDERDMMYGMDRNMWNRENMYNREWNRECMTPFNRDWTMYNRDWNMTPYNREWNMYNRDWNMTPYNREWNMYNRDWNMTPYNRDWTRECMPTPYNREWTRERTMTPFNRDWTMTPYTRDFWPIERTMESMLRTPLELTNMAMRPCNWTELYTLEHPIRVLDREGNRELFLCYDLSGFKPEECNVTFDRKLRCITVEAKHEVKDKECQVMRHFSRKFVLPKSLESIDLAKCCDELKTCLTSNGMLHIRLALPKLEAKDLKTCPTMCDNVMTPYARYFGCTEGSCNTTPINTKVC